MALAHILAELRDDHGLDPADGLQLVSPRTLVRRPVDPTMALLIVPDDPGVGSAAAALSDPCRLRIRVACGTGCAGVPAHTAARPGRPWRGRRRPAAPAVSRGASRGRPGRRAGYHGGCHHGDRSGKRRPRAGAAGRPDERGQPMGAALAGGPAAGARRLSLGPRAGPPDAAAVPAGGGVRGLRRAGRGARPEARRGAGRPAAPDRAPRGVRRGGGHLRPVGCPAVDHDQDRASASPRVR